MSAPVLPRAELVTLATFDMTCQTTGQQGSENVGGPQAFCPAVALVVRADDANAATIKWGMGASPTDPLAKGETVAIDLPSGFYMDLNMLCIRGTAGDILHVVAAIPQSVPPGR